MAKFIKMTGLQAFQKNIFENQRKLTTPRLRKRSINGRVHAALTLGKLRPKCWQLYVLSIIL